MTWIEGIDAAWSRPTPAQLVAAGKHFIVGYVSHDVSKNLTEEECQAYLDAGIAVGLVWETTQERALSGRAGGSPDGIEARRQARALGFPDSKPIGFAVDFNATAQQLQALVGPYGIAFREGVTTSGVYGGKRTIRYFADNHLADHFWQTYAWSTAGTTISKMRANPDDFGWDPRADVQQYHNGVSISGHDTDLDRAKDLSAFWTKENQDMTYPTAAEIENKVWHTAGSAKPGQSAGTTLGDVLDTADRIEAEVKALQVPAGSVDIDALVAALRPVIAEEIGIALNKTGTTFTLNYSG
jgi:hypothetical protein